MDYLLTVSLAKLFKVDTLTAGIAGPVFGGLVHFFLGRSWVFRAAGGRIGKQAVRYLLVWTGSLLLNAGGLYLAVEVGGVDIAIAKIIVSLFVAMAYNYPLQKRYVFYNN